MQNYAVRWHLQDVVCVIGKTDHVSNSCAVV